MSLLEVRKISKSFGQVQVLKDVDFSVKAGEVHALLGVNGAGKSTLVKILSGDYTKDTGKIQLNGEEVSFKNPAEAKKNGIAMVVQEVDTALISNLSVVENLTLDDTLSGSPFGAVSWKKRKRKAVELLQRVNKKIDLNKLVSQCSLSEKQMILIARASAANASFIIFDEPTAPLSDSETKQLFEVIAGLKNEGIGMIYISHRMNEIKKIADRLTIMRDGKVVDVQKTEDLSVEEIISKMLGKTLKSADYTHRELGSKIAFEVKDVKVPETGSSFSLKVKEGEVVGIAGLVGAGKSETANALFGASRTKGSWLINGIEKRIHSPLDAIHAGISFVPEERRKSGILIDFSVKDNLSLPAIKSFSPYGWLQQNKERDSALAQMKELGISASSPLTLLKHLSGGNQQKVSIGKWLNRESSVFLFDEPTKGIDVGAKNDVFRLIASLAEEKKGIVYFTSEFDELLQIADRILVMYDGEIIEELTNAEASHEKIMQAATGGNTVEATDRIEQLSSSGKA
ncbi:ABC transporter [Jeotgalibacillus proteolyticus]|uniref:Autoinducer 2 import ATP-binding protein LsrA n=2 Tax=Jeotgalibacillus proteolyticus TaxID=2082395 RepID=A0A2S5GA43_9BACL|nr:ABC transporter [Jeotgalibacillus proteolyticus]